MAKYQEEVKVLLDAIGGKANIQAVSHCMTRMRFVLVNPKKADEQAIEAISCVKGTFTQAGQFQVIIGNDVANFYKEFTQYAGIEGVSKDAVKSAAKTNQNPVQRIMGALGEIFAPIIPALICGGLVLGFRNIIGEVDLLNGRTQSLADVSQFWAGMYSFLWLIGEAIFHFLPVGITWSITKKMGTTQILGIVLGLTLISPQLLNGFSVATTAAEDIPVWDFGFAQVQMIGYQGQVIAAIMAGFVLVYLEKFFQKICPEPSCAWHSAAWRCCLSRSSSSIPAGNGRAAGPESRQFFKFGKMTVFSHTAKFYHDLTKLFAYNAVISQFCLLGNPSNPRFFSVFCASYTNNSLEKGVSCPNAFLSLYVIINMLVGTRNLDEMTNQIRIRRTWTKRRQTEYEKIRVPVLRGQRLHA